MSRRFLATCLISAGLVLAGSSLLAGAEAPAKNKLVTKLYPVIDLVIPFDVSRDTATVNVETLGFASLQAPPTGNPVIVSHQGIVSCTGSCASKTCPKDEPTVSASTSAQADVARQKPIKTTEEALMKLVTNTVAPQTWNAMGGEGRMDYFPLGMALVVTQTPEVQEQVEQLLKSLRRLQDVQVVLELRFVTVTDKCFAQASRELGIEAMACETSAKNGATSAAFLNDRQVQKLLKKLEMSRQTYTMQAPKMTVFNGTESTFRIAESQYFVTSVRSVQAGGEHVLVPENKPISYGFELSVLPSVSADRRYVRLNLRADETCISQVDLFPITSFITPVFEGGAVGQPLPFTQFIQQPKLTRLSLRKSFCVPDGGTMLLSGWKPLRTPSTEEKPRFVEILDTLCPPSASAKETETVMVMVTPRIIVNTEEELPARSAAAPPAYTPENLAKPSEPTALPSTPKLHGFVGLFANPPGDAHAKVVDILGNYQQACFEGRLAEAKELAKKALAIDPACFSRNFLGRGQEKTDSR